MWNSLVWRASRDAVRSCTRGLGGPRKALPLPSDRLEELPDGADPWVPAGPIGPKNLVVLGSWFLLREVEAAAATVGDLRITLNKGKPKAEWRLPASKTDQRAEGVTRTHGCSCQGSPRTDCPAHVAWAHASMLIKKFGDRGVDAPLFPNVKGEMCQKDAVAATLVAAARHLNIPTETPTGRISGHTLRVTGAQGLAAMGLDLWAVQLLGRWGSAAVKGYVQEAHLAKAEGWAAKAKNDRDLDTMVGELVDKVEKGLRGKDLWTMVLAQAKEAVKQALGERQGQQPVQQEVAEALAVEAVATCSKGSPALDAVMSSGGIAHAVLFGPSDGDLDMMATICGWRFGKAKGAKLLQKADLKVEYKMLCARCFSSEREQAKKALASQASKLEE